MSMRNIMCAHSFFYIICLGILKLKFPKFLKYAKNVLEAEIFFRVFLGVEGL